MEQMGTGVKIAFPISNNLRFGQEFGQNLLGSSLRAPKGRGNLLNFHRDRFASARDDYVLKNVRTLVQRSATIP